MLPHRTLTPMITPAAYQPGSCRPRHQQGTNNMKYMILVVLTWVLSMTGYACKPRQQARNANVVLRLLASLPWLDSDEAAGHPHAVEAVYRRIAAFRTLVIGAAITEYLRDRRN